jgi:thioredoxin reductase (NADPH)
VSLDLSASVEETPDVYGAYPSLSEQQLSALASVGEERPVQPGDILYREGEGTGDFFVIVEGKVAVVEESSGGRRTIGIHGPRRFLGELGLLTGQAVFLTAVVREPGKVLVVKAEILRKIVTQDQVLGDLILRSFILRRSILIGLGVGIRIIGSRHSPDTRRLREFAIRNRLPHHWVDLESDPGAEDLLRRVAIEPSDCPVVLLGPGRVLRNPSNIELARALGLRPADILEMTYDVVVVGAGPAGLAAAVYGASEGLQTVVLEALATGGQAGTSSRIENYLGFPAGVSGAELAERATLQARKFGAELVLPAGATDLEPIDGGFRLQLGDGGAVTGRTVVIATGVRYRKLPVSGLAELEGISVHYAATLMEAQLCRGDPVALVGGGNSAGQATLFLSRFVPSLTLVIRESELGQNMSRYLADRIERLPNVEVVPDSEVREMIAHDTLESIVVENNQTGERRTISARALFVFIGAEPHSEWLHGRVALDDGGYILTGNDAATAQYASGDGDGNRRSQLLLETTLPGVFAAGDVRSGSTQRVSAAVGDGAIAIRHIHRLLSGAIHEIRLAQTYVSSK